MALPTPPAGPARRLLEVTWEMAGGLGRWPVFAELDRHLYSGYDIQALDVMRVISPGFLYGVGPSTPLQPGESQEIGLTVAGVAACPGTREILSVFVEFIQVAVAVEKEWLPPPARPGDPPVLTAAGFAARARTLPAAGRDHLLQLLHLIVQAERSGWAGLSANTGTGEWSVFLTREIRAFVGVADIEDYWSRRYKPWAPRHPSPHSGPPAGSEGPADTSHAGAPRHPDDAGLKFARASGVQLGSGNVQFNYFSGGTPVSGAASTRQAPTSGHAGSPAEGHAFISYVREDCDEVDALQKMLEDAGIPVWRDTSSLWPGEDWRAKIRGAISRDALVFIACFSSRSVARQVSYQNEELLLAIEQLRRRRPDDPWLIPVRFDDCDIPDFDLGAGRTLAAINRADLFGANRERSAQRLVEAVERLLR
jgi:hypothetical protein